jgi:integrase
MATIVKKKLKKGIKYYVVYSFIDSNGKRKQKWEPYEKHQEALKRKGEIEFKSAEREYIKPNSMTVQEFMELFVSNYGMERWAFSTYDSNVGIIRHYGNPTLGDVKIHEVTPLFITSYYQRLTKVKAVPHRTGEATGKCLSKTQVRGIHKLLRCAFGFAAEMELIADNPFAKIKAPKASYKKREAWTPDTIHQALNLCKDNRLFMAINLAFACSMRIGEVLGLTWDNIHISSDDLEQGNAHLFIEKELQRASLESIQKLKSEDIFYIF